MEMLDAIPENVTLILAGKFATDDLYKEVQHHKNWNKVEFLGFINAVKRKEILEKSILGLILLHPTKTFVDAIPVKLFEYMEAGIPVIASNFKILQDIIEKANCGFCLDPLNTALVSDKISELIKFPDLAKTMGENGRKAINENYSWQKESEKLLAVYEAILNEKK
jgi:glycosyltransferase involved in cell wall biosynthesis